MIRTTHSPLFVTKELFDSRYQGAEAIFVAGSVMRGEASNYSDLDLVVVFPKIERAYRESFIHKEWPVEAFIHDPDTIRYFFSNLDRPIGRATLAEMISEGHEVPGQTPLTAELKNLASQILKEGPPVLSESEIQDRRYHITELIDDIREPRSRQELTATATSLYSELADFYFRARGSWTGTGKALFRRMKKDDPAFARKFDDSFEVLFTSGKTAQVIELASELLSPYGGFLFEGYRHEVPAEWRAR